LILLEFLGFIPTILPTLLPTCRCGTEISREAEDLAPKLAMK
jgi:hypothetical protein